MKAAMLVYQAGIANVFEVGCFNLAEFGRDAKRLIQADFRTCEAFARGIVASGISVSSAHCNEAGDIVNSKWSAYLEDAPFFEDMRPVSYMKHLL